MTTKKNVSTVLGVIFYILKINAQVGINATNSKVSLAVCAQTFDSITVDRLLVPRLILKQPNLKSDTQSLPELLYTFPE